MNNNKISTFVAVCDCAVAYNGRASSILERGRYLILIKPDRSIAIHGGTAIKPLNYQNGKSTITTVTPDDQYYMDICDNLFTDIPEYVIKSVNKKETLLVAVYSTDTTMRLDTLSNNKVQLVRSERDLQHKIFNNIERYIDKPITILETEASTPYGPIDIMGVDIDNTYHIIEIKRKVAGVAAISQVCRYRSWYRQQGKEVIAYVSAPSLANGAETYLSAEDVKYLKVDFD